MVVTRDWLVSRCVTRTEAPGTAADFAATLHPRVASRTLENLLEARDVVLLDHSNGAPTRVDGRSFVVSAPGWQRVTDQVRETIQHTLYQLLMQRRSVFF